MFSSIEGVELGDVEHAARILLDSGEIIDGHSELIDEDDMEGEDSEEEDEGMEVDKEYSDKYDEKSMEDDDQDGKDEDYFNLQHAWEILAMLFLQVFYRQLL